MAPGVLSAKSSRTVLGDDHNNNSTSNLRSALSMATLRNASLNPKASFLSKSSISGASVTPSTKNEYNGSGTSTPTTIPPIIAQSAGPPPPPDGGLRAWLCVAGGALTFFSAFGWITAIGTFQTYYQTVLLSDLPASTIAWIVSLEIFFMFALGSGFGYIFDTKGPHGLMALGSFLHVFGLMMASLGSEFWHLILAQGIVSPVGASMLFYASIGSVATWFAKRRALAMGVLAAGSGVGGVVFPIMVSRLIERVGFAWAMRSAAFLHLFVLVIANLTVRARMPPTKRTFVVSVFVKPLGELQFSLLVLSSFLFFFGMYVPYNYLALSARDAGMSPNLAQYLLPMINAGSVLGRLLPGWAADHLGRFNVTVVMCLFSGVMVWGLWVPATGNAMFIVFAVLYGFGSGALIGLLPVLVAQISEIKDIGLRTGTAFTVLSISALCSNPIAGALLGPGNDDFINLKIWSGVLLCSGTFMLLVTRMVVSKGAIWVKI